MNIVPAQRVSEVQEYYFSKKLKEVAQLNAQGADIISLGIGGPDRPPHKDVIDTLCNEANVDSNHSYQPYVGIPQLRQAFARWYNRWYGVELNPDTEIQPLIRILRLGNPPVHPLQCHYEGRTQKAFQARRGCQTINHIIIE